ncbi:hypothetical protein ACC685_33405 [Rhizobium ruizarguesonis]
MTTPFVEDGGLLKVTDVLYAVADGRTTEADALKLLKLEHRGALYALMRKADLYPSALASQIEQRNIDLAELEFAMQQTKHADFGRIYREAIDQLTAQIVSYQPGSGPETAEEHFLDGNGLSVAERAFRAVDDIERQHRERIARLARDRSHYANDWTPIERPKADD